MAEQSNGASCPMCGLPLPSLFDAALDAPTIAELTREITYLRETVARLRGSGFTGAPDQPAEAGQTGEMSTGGDSDHAH
jgi:hypothetical protein